MFAPAYPFLAALDIAFTLLCVVAINWWAPLFARRAIIDTNGQVVDSPAGPFRLPNWLKWVDTFDGDLDTGNRELGWTFLGQYFGRVRWLYRNTAYGFGYWVLGSAFDPARWRIVKDDVDASKAWAPKARLFLAVGPGGRFNLTGAILGVQYKFGWKAWNYYDPITRGWKRGNWGPARRVPIVSSIKRA